MGRQSSASHTGPGRAVPGAHHQPGQSRSQGTVPAARRCAVPAGKRLVRPGRRAALRRRGRVGVEIRTVLYTERAREAYEPYLRPLLAVCSDCREIDAALAARFSDTKAPQGIFCICRRLDNRLPLGKIKRNGRYLLLEDVQDPGNLGTIVRTAEAFGIDGLFLTSGCCDLYNPKVLRGSMGGVFRLPTARTGRPAGFAGVPEGCGSDLLRLCGGGRRPAGSECGTRGGGGLPHRQRRGGPAARDRRGLRETDHHPHERPRGIPECVHRGIHRVMGNDPFRLSALSG